MEWNVADARFRRVGSALATVALTLEASPRHARPPADARLRIASPSTSVEVSAMMVTHDVPGTPREAHRLWFSADLSWLMFGDGTFTLALDDVEVPVPHPVATSEWGAEEDGEAVGSAWSESELRAAVAALEERCRSAERGAAELRGVAGTALDESELAAKLTSAWRELEVLQELLETRESAYRAVKNVLDATAADRDARRAEIDVLRAELERLQREAGNRDHAVRLDIDRAQERAAEGRRMVEVVAATLADAQREREELIARVERATAELDEARAERDRAAAAAAAVQSDIPAPQRPRRRGLLGALQSVGGNHQDKTIEHQRRAIRDLQERLKEAEAQAARTATVEEALRTAERTQQELRAQMDEQGNELTCVYATLNELRARTEAPPPPAPPVSDGIPVTNAELLARIGAARGASNENA